MKKTIIFICFCIMLLLCAFTIHWTEPYVGLGAAIFMVVPAAAVILMNVAIRIYDH